MMNESRINIKDKQVRTNPIAEYGVSLSIILLLMLFIIPMSVSASLPVSGDCSEVSATIMTPQFASNGISFSAESLRTYDINVQTVVTLTPGSGVTIVPGSVNFVPAVDGSSVNVHNIVENPVSANKYTLNFNVKLGSRSNLDSFRNSGIDLSNKMAAQFQYTKDGVTKCGYAYLNGLSLAFTGQLGQLPAKA